MIVQLPKESLVYRLSGECALTAVVLISKPSRRRMTKLSINSIYTQLSERATL